MKTMISMDKKHIKRVTDEKAVELYHGGDWNYTHKSVWKEQVRDVDNGVHKSPVGAGFAHKDTKSNKMSKSTKRHMRKTNK